MESRLDKIIQAAEKFDRKSVNYDETENGRLEFVKRFPIENLKNMTLEEYSSGTTDDSFCYWLEFKNISFGIGGGNANKFGVYKGKDGNYYNKVGQKKLPLSTVEAITVFEKIKKSIIDCLEFLRNNEFEKLLDLNLPMWPMVFTKILQIYYPESFICIGKNTTILQCAADLGIEIPNQQNNTVYINHLIKDRLSEMETFKDWNYEELSVFLWKYYTSSKNPRFFKIAPGPKGEIWNECVENSEIRLDFSRVQSLENFSSQDEIFKYLKDNNIFGGSQNKFKAEELWKFKNIKIGDMVLANNGVSGILGYGKVKGDYFFAEDSGEYRHRIPVEWYETNYKQIQLPDVWRFNTVAEINENEFNGNFQANYWIFQANPNIFDVFTALKEEKIESWLVNQHKNEIKIGDKVILWVTGEKSGCYALAEVLENPKESILEPDDYFWKEAKPSGLRVRIEITHNFVNNPILKNEIINIPEFKNFKAGNQGTNLKATKEEYEKMIELSHKTMGDNKRSFSHPKNLILYGPPGTGKTFSTKRKAVEVLLNGNIENVDIDAEFKKLKAEGRIEFVTFHQSYSYEQFVEGISVLTKDGNVVYEVRDGVFKSISNKAKNPESNLNDMIEWLCNELDEKEILTLKSSRSEFTVTYRGTNGFWAIPTNSTIEHNVSFNSLRKYYENPQNALIPNRTYAKGIYNYLLEKGLKAIDYSSEMSQKNFVLIIDEINRGNISKIFGELITLIEDDKRLGEENEIIVTLPYSGEQFGVPPNLYIIGTMNTADRSLVQLDTALRRRFEFEEMMPKYHETDNLKALKDSEKIQKLEWGNSGKVDEFDLSLFLFKLNEKISEQYDREHQIGHSFLMKVNSILKEGYDNDSKELYSLKRAWENKIMPLLQEYFYANYEDLAKVIGVSEYLSKKDDDKWKLNMKASEGKFEDEFYKVYDFVTK